MIGALLTGGALAGVAVLRTSTQLRQMRRGGSQGVSSASLAAWVAVNAGWVAYTFWVSLPAGLISEVCYLVGSAALVARMRRDGRLTRRGLSFGLFVAAAYTAAAGIGAAGATGPQLLGDALEGSVLCYGIPALVVALRASSVTGLSRAALAVTAVDASLALAYGVVMSDRTYLAYGVTQQVLTLPVLIRVCLATPYRPLHRQPAADQPRRPQNLNASPFPSGRAGGRARPAGLRAALCPPRDRRGTKIDVGLATPRTVTQASRGRPGT